MKKSHDKQEGLAEHIEILPSICYLYLKSGRNLFSNRMYTIYVCQKGPNDPSGQPWDLYENLRQSAEQRRVPDADAEAEAVDKLAKGLDCLKIHLIGVVEQLEKKGSHLEKLPPGEAISEEMGARVYMKLFEPPFVAILISQAVKLRF